jgi:hypothetical protein
MEFRSHPHGAIDIAAPVNTPIYAPEKGLLYYFKAVRHNTSDSWREVDWRDGEQFPFQNYFYDLYGSVILIVGTVSGYFHVICHSWWNQLYGKIPKLRELIEYQEENRVERFSIEAYHNLSNAIIKEEGDLIGYVGNAGYSTGPHVHYEIHDNKYQKHNDRVDPGELFKGMI